MKKLITTFSALALFAFGAFANPVTEGTAQKVAKNFFSRVSSLRNISATLAYTETDSLNEPIYYVFNVNSTKGFIIVSANNIFHPIIGYSTEKRPYTVPTKGTNMYYWMQRRKTEMISDLRAQLKASTAITSEWSKYLSADAPSHSTNRIMSLSIFPSSTAYLVKSLWDQPAPYNDDCPGTGSNQAVTGCVATTMCQIMRYWQYPATGKGASSYWAYNYGTLSAKYNHPYAWAAMPLYNPSTGDTGLARVMSDAGISVNMDYSPTGSGAEVITADNPYACSQIAYAKYFKYSTAIMDGIDAFSNVTAWQDTIKHELDRNRPVQYVGSDVNAGGHTWVCDGYDMNNYFHMNWGWSGADDGWYALNNLNPSGYDFIQNQEALIGIMPPSATAKPKAGFAASATKACLGNTVQFIDTSTEQPTSWLWSFSGGTPSTSTQQDPIVTYSVTGTYSVQLTATNGFGSNTVTSASYVQVDSTPAKPVVHQSGAVISCVPATYSHYQWYRNNVLMPGYTSSQFTASQIGLYKVFVSNTSGCTVMSNNLGVTNLGLGINELVQSDNINVYPNPANTEVNISWNTPLNGYYLFSVSDVVGQTVYKENVHLDGLFTLSINVSKWGKGVYILSMQGTDTKIVKSIIVR